MNALDEPVVSTFTDVAGDAAVVEPEQGLVLDVASTPRRRWLAGFADDRTALLGAVVLGSLIALAAIGPWLVPQNPYDLAQLDILDARLPPGSASGDGHLRYWLGTDSQGRDMLSAMVHGLRISVVIGIVSTFFAALGGVALGLVAGYRGGRIDAFVSRLADLQLSIPSILVALILLAFLRPGLANVVIALITVQWAYYARTARATALVERNKEYVLAARAYGASTTRIVFRHLLPNCLPPLLVVAALQIAGAITLEATLSFLGLGVPITEPSLGLLIANGFQLLFAGKYWISIFPGLVLGSLIVSLNLVADRLSELSNPRLRRD